MYFFYLLFIIYNGDFMRIAMCGYLGKTGKEVYQVLKENNYQVIGIDLKTLPLENYIDDVDMVIDFTNKETSLKHIGLCFEHNKPFIVGTTGFTSDELAKIKSQCHQLNLKGIICYNFALPINFLLKQFAFFNTYFQDFTYLDIHHVSKIDKVSGTTYLFLLQNYKIKIKSLKTTKNIITYVIQMQTKYDKMIISYQVSDKKVFALGLLNYLQTLDERSIINLI